MSRILIYVFAFLCTITAVAAATYTDTLDADFTAGNASTVNVTADTVILQLANATHYNNSGTFLSQVFNLGSNPANKTIAWNFVTPTNTSLLISTRSGANATDFSAWSAWSSDYATSTGSTVTSSQARYLQYRAQLATTDNASTPTLQDATITYDEAGISILAATTYNANLTSLSSGNFNFHANVSDTYAIMNVTGRYRYNSSGAYSSSINLTAVATGIYNLSIPQPAGNWTAYTLGTLDFEVTATTTNGSSFFNQTVTLQELIEFANTAPTLDPIANYTVTQNQTFNITITWTDPNANQTVTITTNVSSITATALTSTSASLTWIPNATHVGSNAITVTANDTYTTATRVFIVNVTDINDAPIFTSVPTSITGYYGVRQQLTYAAYDPDNGTNLTFSVSPTYFRLTTATSTNGSNASSGMFYGVGNLTPAYDERGVHNVTVTVSDGTLNANTSAIMTIDYCGDNTCQSTYESTTSCSMDCAPVSQIDGISLIVPDRNCANTTMTIWTFNATNRFSCYYQGLVESGLALCDPLESVAVAVYVRNGTLLTDAASLSSAANGTVTFTPTTAGEYKFVATKDGYSNSSQIVVVRDCSADITVTEQNITIEQPPLPPIEEKPAIPPEENIPGLLEAEASLLQLLLFYVAAPLLLAMMVYGGMVFYDVNKDSLPALLETRITFYELRMRYDPQLQRLKAMIWPYWEPVWLSVKALWDAVVPPVKAFVTETLKKLRR